jgi:uncharacterized protein
MDLEILTAGCRNPALTGKCAMGVMIKTPHHGFSKTRLCPPLVSEEAANISRCFLKDTSAAIQALCEEDPFLIGVAIYTPVGSEAVLAELLPTGFKMIAQRAGDLGIRLFGAAEDLFSAGFSAVCLMGSDSPTLPINCLRDLSVFLKEPEDRVMIGPCQDGGYYVIGLRQAHRRLFEDVAWDTDRVYVQTVERAKEINLPISTLPKWYDVDDQISLSRLLSELFPEYASKVVPRGSPALSTREFLCHILLEGGTGRIWPQSSLLCKQPK